MCSDTWVSDVNGYSSCRYDEPGAWYAMLPLEIVYAFDPIPPPPPEYLTLADTLQPTADGFAPLHGHV